QKNVRDKRNGIDAVGQRADVGASGALGELFGLIRIKKISDQDGDRGSGQDASVDQFRREAENKAAKTVDQQKLDKIIERQPEKAVNIAAHEPSHGARGYRRRGEPTVESSAWRRRGLDRKAHRQECLCYRRRFAAAL